MTTTMMTVKLVVSLVVVVAAVLYYRYCCSHDLRASLQLGGTCADEFAEVQETFKTNFANGLEGEGAALAVYWKGRKVVDIWGGFADREIEKPWKQDTIAVAHSMTKGIAAVCLALLYDRNKFSYDDKVVKYWPEFGQGGKEEITIKQLVNHQAGLCCYDEDGEFTFPDLNNTEKMSRIFEKKQPLWKPGSASGYHSMTFGPLMDQLIRRIDEKKRSVGQFFREEIAEPFGIDFHIGLPHSEHYRMARVKNNLLKILWHTLLDPAMRPGFSEYLFGSKDSLFLRATRHPDYLQELHKFNNPDWSRMEFPSAIGIGTAESLAKLYSLLIDGQGRLLRAETVDFLRTPQLVEPDIVLLSQMTARGWGFHHYKEKGYWAFGHSGFGGQMSYADHVHHLTIGYITSDNGGYHSLDDPRFSAIKDTIYRLIQSKQPSQ